MPRLRLSALADPRGSAMGDECRKLSFGAIVRLTAFGCITAERFVVVGCPGILIACCHWGAVGFF
jgi:hypothetical protein